MKTLDRYRHNVHSQNGEDGVIAEIMRRIGLSQVEIDYPECLFDASWLSAGPARTVRGWAARLARRARRILPG